MYKAHPIPKTDATRAPKVGRFILDHLKSRLPKGEDGDLAQIQVTTLSVCGPMTCLWAELIDSGLLSDLEATVNVHDVLNIIQRSLVLLGNANKMVSQLRRSKVLQRVDRSVEKYGQESRPDSGEFLFGADFTKDLKGQVETDTSLAQVISMSQRFTHIMTHVSQPSLEPNNSFFEETWTGSGDLSKAMPIPHHITSFTNQQLRTGI